WIARENGAPETIRQHDGTVRLGAVVLRADQAAENRVQAHNVKIIAADNAGLHFTRFAEANHCETDDREIAEFANTVYSRLQVLNLGYRKVRVLFPEARRALPDVDERAFVAIDERLEQYATNERENGGICANAQRQSDNYGNRQSRRAPQGFKGNPQISEEFHRCSPHVELLRAYRVPMQSSTCGTSYLLGEILPLKICTPQRKFSICFL